MTAPHGDIARSRATTARLLSSIDRAGRAAVEGPCLLPVWSRAHLLTHLARNADSQTWMLQGALAGEVRDQYPGGAEGRAADIEAGAGRAADEVVADLRRSCAALDAAWDAMTDSAWDGMVRLIHQGEVEAHILPDRRAREVEIHHVDLDIGYGPGDWPVEFVLVQLGQVVAGVGARLPAGMGVDITLTDAPDRWAVGAGETVAVRGPAADVLAWMLGRATSVGGTEAPALGPWA